MNKGVLIGGLVGVLSVCGVFARSMYAQSSSATQPEESRETMLQRLSIQSGFSIDKLVQIEQEMKKPVRESLPPSENVIYLQSWGEFQQMRGYEPPKEWTKREEWDKHLAMFREYAGTVHQQVDTIVAQSDVLLEERKNLIVFLYTDDSSNEKMFAPSRGLAHILARMVREKADLSIVSVDLTDSLAPGLYAGQSTVVQTIFDTVKDPSALVYSSTPEGVQRVERCSGGPVEISDWVRTYTLVSKALPSATVLRTQ